MSKHFEGWVTWKSLIAAHHLAKFNGHRHCGTRNIMYLICYMGLQHHQMKGPCNFMEGNCSLYIVILPSLLDIVTTVVEINLICHVTFQNHKIKVLCWWWYSRQAFLCTAVALAKMLYISNFMYQMAMRCLHAFPSKLRFVICLKILTPAALNFYNFFTSNP